MPILAFSDNPPSRHPFDLPIIDSKQVWWIAKVKPRQEKALAKDLLDLGVEYYLPFFVKTSSRPDSRAVRKSLLPLFPSYVPFACGPDPWFLLQNNRMCTILPVSAQEKFKHELNQIYMAYEKNVYLAPATKNEYSVGTRVQVVAGPLRGVNGIIVKIKDSDFLVLRVECLGEACVSIDPRNVKPESPK